MKSADSGLIYSPSDLITYMNDEFSSWMDHYYLHHRNEIAPDDDDGAVRIAQTHGDRHELAYLNFLREAGVGIFEVDFERPDAVEQTVLAMTQGHDVIYQGVLRLEPFEGRSDFLFRVPGKSLLGDFHYEVWDTKLARKPKPYFLIQLCCYAEMLEQIQGVLPENVGIILGDQSRKIYRTRSFINYYLGLKRRFVEFHLSYDEKTSPLPVVSSLSRWRSVADEKIKSTDHLIQIAGIRSSQMKKLCEAGLDTVQKLVDSDIACVDRMSLKTFNSLKRQATLQVQSRKLGSPLFEVIPRGQNEPRRGLSLLPESSSGDVWFDMEGYPYVTGGLEYLFGAVCIENSQPVFHDWWAHDSVSERVAFEQFIDWVYARFIAHPTMHIYHYGAYEVSALRRLSTRHGTREDQVDDMLRAEIFVDLYRVVRQGLVVGTESYSIKYIERLYMPKRKQEVAKATDSIVFYERWLEEPDSLDPKVSKILGEIREYNRIDCESTRMLNDWLRDVQASNRIDYAPPVPFVARTAITVRPADQLALRILGQCPEGAVLDSEWRLHLMLAHLLNFYRRETKPVFWERFNWRDMTEQELHADPDCLAGLVLHGAPETVKKSLAYTFLFDPDQETSFEEGDEFICRHEFKCEGKVAEIDRVNGRIVLLLGPTRPVPPRKISILPKEFTDFRKLESAILTTVQDWFDSGELPLALKDLLSRKPPRLRAVDVEVADSFELAVRKILKLDNSYLCVQGPPGTGKTTLASRAIAELLKTGAKVGVTANSHKASSNLLDTAALACEQASITPKIAKLGEENSRHPFRFRSSLVELKKEASKFWINDSAEYQLMGGTPWAFSSEHARTKLDYLFVDEAGQVSLAHLAAMGASAKNIVLIGDQMQLEQPIQGTHPGECGKSCLEYLLAGQATIPEELGVFLDITRRMHPDLTDLVSDAVYNGRLKSHPVTRNNSLITNRHHQLLRKTNGIQFLPVRHVGNSQASEDEADVIVNLVNELLTCSVQLRDQPSRPMTVDDILIVAPYNKQIRLLWKLVPQGLEVGTVDKFQGKEAAVVIVSMCASDVEGAPRGLEFLFSKNRLNVAISRAHCLAVVVGNPGLLDTACNSIEQMEMLNFFCRIAKEGEA